MHVLLSNSQARPDKNFSKPHTFLICQLSKSCTDTSLFLSALEIGSTYDVACELVVTTLSNLVADDDIVGLLLLSGFSHILSPCNLVSLFLLIHPNNDIRSCLPSLSLCSEDDAL